MRIVTALLSLVAGLLGFVLAVMVFRSRALQTATLLVGLVLNTMAAPGGLDAACNPGVGADGNVQAIVVQPDGTILLGGAFSSFNGVSRHRIARILADGTVDTGFSSPNGVDGTVYSLVRQVDGRIIIGGNFYGVNGSNNRGIARLNADGTLDLGFDPVGGPSGAVLEFLAVRGRNYSVVGSADLKSWVPMSFRPLLPEVAADSDPVSTYLSPDVRLLQVSVPAPATGPVPLFYKLQIR